MPPPNSENGRNNVPGGTSGNKTRIDFSPSLDSIDPKCPQSPSGNQDASAWDTETDHILSYFLGGDAIVGAASHEEHGFTSASHSHSRDATHSGNVDEEGEQMHLPPTPSVQFYSRLSSHDNNRNAQHRRHPKQTTTSSQDGTESKMKSSLKFSRSVIDQSLAPSGVDGSKLASCSRGAMTASLLSGASLSQQHHERSYQQLYQRKDDNGLDSHANGLHNYGSDNPSPISPAAMIGLANENLLLPLPSPTGRDNADNGKLSTFSSYVGLQQSQLAPLPQAPSSSSLVGIFGISNHENRLLPPEKLLEIFPNQNQSSSAVALETVARSQNEGNNRTMPVQGTTIVVMGNPAESGGQHHINAAPILSNQHTTALHPPHFLFANQSDFAAAILNHHHGLLSSSATPQVESEEKRAKRLERNRESARKSRRKKKERLLTLGGQVNRLQNEIEIERRRHINSMVPVMNKLRLDDIRLLMQRLYAGELFLDSISDQTCVVIQQSGPNSRLMRSVLDFQYTTLKQLTLPSYQKILLWFTLLDESFFTSGKEEYAKRVAASNAKIGGKQSVRSSPVASVVKNISSKQIGDELFNGFKNDAVSKGKKKRDKERENDSGDRPNVTSNSHDGSHTWPLLSFELRLSVDQEERFLSTHKQLRHSSMMKYRLADGNRIDTLENHRSQMVAAYNTAESLSKAVGSLSHVISRREDKTLARVLRPDQLLAFQTWLNNSSNRVRCRDQISSVQVQSGQLRAASDLPKAIASPDVEMDVGAVGGTCSKEASLQDICRRLNEVLHISQQ